MRAGTRCPGSALLLLCLSLLSGPANAQSNPHETPDSASCGQCHLRQPRAQPARDTAHRLDWTAFRGNGIDMCTSCHEDSADMHPLGIPLDFPVPADLPLDRNKGMTCLTCHYVHGRLASDRPWASVSFMDRMTDSERMHKTYLLRRNNAEGALCLICHDTSRSSP